MRSSLSLAPVAQLDRRIELTIAAPEQEGHGGALLKLGDLRVELIRASCLDGRATIDDGEDDVASLNVAARRSGDVLDADDALEKRWSDSVPVLLAGDRELCRYRIDEAAVTAFLLGEGTAKSR